jgi:hypothetical protein
MKTHPGGSVVAALEVRIAEKEEAEPGRVAFRGRLCVLHFRRCAASAPHAALREKASRRDEELQTFAMKSAKFLADFLIL